jgi:tetratricopeptide (TPR) repeat protein
VRSAQDSGAVEVVSTAAQRIATGGAAAEPRFAGAEISRAIDQLDRAAAINPADLSIHQRRLFLALGSGDYGRAIESLEASLRAHTQTPPEVWLQHLGGFPRAKANHAAVFARAIVTKYPDNASAHVALGAWLDVTGHDKEAKYHLERALALDSTHAMAHWRLAEVLEQSSDSDGAREHYKASIALDGELTDERREEYQRRVGP